MGTCGTADTAELSGWECVKNSQWLTREAVVHNSQGAVVYTAAIIPEGEQQHIKSELSLTEQGVITMRLVAMCGCPHQWDNKQPPESVPRKHAIIIAATCVHAWCRIQGQSHRLDRCAHKQPQMHPTLRLGLPRLDQWLACSLSSCGIHDRLSAFQCDWMAARTFWRDCRYL